MGRAADRGEPEQETVELIEKSRKEVRSVSRATLAALAAGAAAMAIDETGYWAAIAAGLAAAAAVYGVPTGGVTAKAPKGEVDHMRQEQRHGTV